jgi:UDP-glucose:(heptosyl)LPS alpha-1,3-glucosyltransferase
MRVAILSRRWSVRAGNERVAVELARQLRARGHEVDLYCQKDDGSAAGVLPPERVHRLFGIGFDPTAAMLTYALSTKRLVSRLRAEKSTHVVIGFGQSLIHDVYRLGGGTHAEFMELSKEMPEARGGPILDRLALELEKIRFRPECSPFLVSPSLRVKEELERHHSVDPRRIFVIPNGIDLERFRPEAGSGERARVRARWGVNLDASVLLFVGQDPERKGFDRALEVARRLDLPLVYVGRAPRPRSLPPNVIWDGERTDVETCYRSADLLIAPSRYDPFGGAVLEALACGLPPIATSRIGATERMRGREIARLLVDSPDEVERMVEAARFALDPDRRAVLRIEAHACTSDASRSEWGEKMEAVLIRAAEARR